MFLISCTKSYCSSHFRDLFVPSYYCLQHTIFLGFIIQFREPPFCTFHFYDVVAPMPTTPFSCLHNCTEELYYSIYKPFGSCFWETHGKSWRALNWLPTLWAEMKTAACRTHCPPHHSLAYTIVRRNYYSIYKPFGSCFWETRKVLACPKLTYILFQCFKGRLDTWSDR